MVEFLRLGPWGLVGFDNPVSDIDPATFPNRGTLVRHPQKLFYYWVVSQ
jgi:hypothetical protein